MVGTSLALLCPPYEFGFAIAKNAATRQAEE